MHAKKKRLLILVAQHSIRHPQQWAGAAYPLESNELGKQSADWLEVKKLLGWEVKCSPFLADLLRKPRPGWNEDNLPDRRGVIPSCSYFSKVAKPALHVNSVKFNFYSTKSQRQPQDTSSCKVTILQRETPSNDLLWALLTDVELFASGFSHIRPAGLMNGVKDGLFCLLQIVCSSEVFFTCYFNNTRIMEIRFIQALTE